MSHQENKWQQETHVLTILRKNNYLLSKWIKNKSGNKHE